ncbi:MAG: hypothetical protein KDB82_16520 [Planctomycetes bacterium]|nr:hypothetical protein [Planctomycetota bacterium]
MTWLLYLAEPLLHLLAWRLFDHLESTSTAGLTPLERELDKLSRELAPYDLRITVSSPAREAMERSCLDRTLAREYVQRHVRRPLGYMIRRGEIEHGDRIFVNWEGAVVLTASRRTRWAADSAGH